MNREDLTIYKSVRQQAQFSQQVTNMGEERDLRFIRQNEVQLMVLTECCFQVIIKTFVKWGNFNIDIKYQGMFFLFGCDNGDMVMQENVPIFGDAF